MKTATFRFIDAINREGLNNSEWGLIEDIESTKEHFGTDRDEQLRGKWLYVYINTNKLYSFILDILLDNKAPILLKPIWYRTDQPNMFVVLIDL